MLHSSRIYPNSFNGCVAESKQSPARPSAAGRPPDFILLFYRATINEGIEAHVNYLFPHMIADYLY